MKSTPTLFLGGPADGQRIAVETYGEFDMPAPMHVVEEMPKLPPISWKPEEPSLEKSEVKQHMYRRELFSSQSRKERWVYVHSSLIGVDLLDYLLAGYRQPK